MAFDFPPAGPAKRKRRFGRKFLLALGVVLIGGAAAVSYFVPIPGITASAGGAQKSTQNEEVAKTTAAIDAQVAQQNALAQQAADLATREAALKQKETQVTDLLKQLTAQKSNGDAIQLVANIYGTMPPAKAAAVMESMDVPTAADILRLLDNGQAGAILAAMKAPAALEITRELAKPVQPVTAAAGTQLPPATQTPAATQPPATDTTAPTAPDASQPPNG